jgi:DNA invertase Pin-like site-specific DNA recombinase
MNNRHAFKPPAALPTGSVVIAYVRDNGGHNQENSRDQQQQVITDYCKQYGLVLNRVYSETASGTARKRSLFSEMFSALMTSPDDARPYGLLVLDYSRLLRNLIELHHFLKSVLSKGIVVHSITDEFQAQIQFLFHN